MKPAPLKSAVTIGDFEKLDIRVGMIQRVEDLPSSRKLVCLTVDFGDHIRTVLVGMKSERQDPAEIEGRQALSVVNLPPRRMAGRTSEAMLFDIGFEDGISLVLAMPGKPVPNGSRAG